MPSCHARSHGCALGEVQSEINGLQRTQSQLHQQTIASGASPGLSCQVNARVGRREATLAALRNKAAYLGQTMRMEPKP